MIYCEMFLWYLSSIGHNQYLYVELEGCQILNTQSNDDLWCCMCITLCFILAQFGKVSRQRLWIVTLHAEKKEEHVIAPLHLLRDYRQGLKTRG